MTAITDTFRRVVRRRAANPRLDTAQEAASGQTVEVPPVEIDPGDPLLAFFAQSTGAVEVDSLDLDSPALSAMREAGVKLIVPLVSQGELIGMLNLGARLSERDYTADDRKLLEDLAGHAAPAVRVAQLVREQEVEIRSRERIEHELRVAQLIQQQFLPQDLPKLPGWDVAAYYQPAREVGGDFYDFLPLPDGRVGIVVGDVTDKGVPAALVMASTHAVLRSEATRVCDPGAVLAQANDLLAQEMPPNMFVTCLFAVLDPATGHLRFANAGHNLPYVRTRDDRVVELRARGMPLGLMAGMDYEERQYTLAAGESVLLHSDGLAEAHNPDRQMFGFDRLRRLTAQRQGGQELIDLLLSELDSFTGPGYEREDDITLVTLQRVSGDAASWVQVHEESAWARQ